MQQSQIVDRTAGGALAFAPAPPKQLHGLTEFTSFQPPAELAAFVTQIYFFRCDQAVVEDWQPAALGHLIFLLKGKGALRFRDGRSDLLAPVSLFGPGKAAAQFRFDGPLHDLGFALSPLGFVALTGATANLYADRAIPASQLFGPEIDSLGETLIAGHADDMRIAEMVRRITAFLLGHVRKIPPEHIALVQAVNDWLSTGLAPEVELLYAQLDMSRSTAARLVARYFGSPPKQLMRKYRALRAASLLVDPECSEATKAQIASLFYDQPHMIREIRQFVGRTPGALESDDARLLRLWLSKNNYRDIETFPG